jgi:hypothetical protein
MLRSALQVLSLIAIRPAEDVVALPVILVSVALPVILVSRVAACE